MWCFEGFMSIDVFYEIIWDQAAMFRFEFHAFIICKYSEKSITINVYYLIEYLQYT